jgi:aspartyl-tRNA(Asn)/glutamyl-tRNA(Gln) amidotransferase subunit A
MSTTALMTIRHLSSAIRNKSLSPVEVTQAILERIQTLNPRINAFISIESDQAMAQARLAEDAIVRGEYLGPLHGVPVGVKDNLAIEGWTTTCGSHYLADNKTSYSATVVEKLRASGAVIVTKDNMHEWAMGNTCSGGPFGTVHNPWDESRVPGGSSGGSAAAVSTSMVYASVGTDGKGSVRMPSSYCGIVGMKPTRGLVSRFGQLPPTSAPHDHVGPLTKDVADAAIMLNALAGYDPRDPTSVPSPAKDYSASCGQGIAGLRVGVPRQFFFEPAEAEVQEAVTRALGVLASLGAEVREVEIPALKYISLVEKSVFDEGHSFLLPLLRQGSRAFADPTIWERLIVRQFARPLDIVKTGQLANAIRRDFLAVMEQVDVLATPTTVSAAFPIGTQAVSADGKPAGRLESPTLLTFPFNLTGMPAISVPCGFTQEGLPIGMTLAGRHWEDDVVLRAAYEYEQAATGGYTPPPVASSVGTSAD